MLRRKQIRSTLLLCSVLLAAAHCGVVPQTKSCTEIGCQDGFHATVANNTGPFPAGMHQLTVAADGVQRSCTFTFPEPLLPTGFMDGPSCSPGLRVDVVQATICTTFEGDGARSQRCEPIAGQFKELITVDGTPAMLQFTQTVDGTPILDESVAAATYQTTQPNGPGCDPICHQGGADWTLR